MDIDAKLVEMIMAIALGASSFWRIAEILLERSKYKKRKAFNLYTQVNTNVISACIAWSQMLETQVTDLEAINADMNSIIHEQALKIDGLEKQIFQLEKENQMFKNDTL
jgi:hypothetical protein